MTAVQLTSEQQQIIEHKQGHARVSAVAGSGKTTAMVARVCRLLERGVAPELIRVFMFNRSAADAFTAQLAQASAGSGIRPPEVQTFHALGLRLVQSFSRRGALPAYRLLTRGYELEKFIRESMKTYAASHDGDDSWFSRDTLELFSTFIDLVKADIRPAGELFAAFNMDERFGYFVGAYDNFERQRKGAGVRFFNDLIREPVLAMTRDRELAAWVENRIEHIIVDEYQDINEVQQQLLRFLAGSRAEVMVVGDVDQCIYEWRGARPEYIVTRFQGDFPEAVSYTLSYTFRFGHRLSLAANHLISNNRLRDRKLCLSHPTTPDTRILLHQEEDSRPVAAIISDWQGRGRFLSEAAVLVRLFSAAVPVELALLEANIPYRLIGHDSVFQCREIRALLGYLSLCQQELGTMEDRQEALAMVTAMLTNPNLWLGEEKNRQLASGIVDDPSRAPHVLRELSTQAKSKFLAGRMLELAATWEKLLHRPLTASAGPLLQRIIDDTELFTFFKRFSSQADADNKIRTCRALVRFARRSGLDVRAFLHHVDELRAREVDGGESLLITSIHRAKGLEWPLVLLPGLEDGVIPYRRDEEDGDGPWEIEDERRLMYVGMTRAVEQLVLLHPADSRFERRNKAGECRSPLSTEDGAWPVSCFLYEANLRVSDQLGDRIASPKPDAGGIAARNIEIARAYLSAVGVDVALEPKSGRRGRKKKKKRKKKTWLGAKEFRRGMQVHHKTLGTGTVKSIGHAQGVVTVEFVEFGLQNLVINLAKLRRVPGKKPD